MATIVGTNGNNLNLNGTGAIDHIFGLGGADTLRGFGSHDQLFGGSGQDQLFGGSGNDRLKGGLGNDLLDGGTGNDTADYSNATIDPPGSVGSIFTTGATAGVTVNLSLAGAQNTGGAGTDTLVSIENLTGSNFNDTLTGNSGNNTLLGLGGNDILNGGSGNDRLDGGAGLDTASYATATAGVTVSLDFQGEAQNTFGAGLDTLVSIENLSGSKFNDTLNSSFADNSTIKGGAGNDRLTTDHISNFILDGEDGNDELFAGPGSGTLNGGAGDDTLFAGDGSFTLNGGTGNDTLSINVFLGGNSTLNGGAGADRLEHTDPPFSGGIVTFDYNAVSDSPAGAGRDTIINFTGVNPLEENENGDRIDLTGIDANTLVSGNQAFIFGGPFTAGHLRYGGGVLQGNIDGDAAAEFEIQLVGAPALFVQAGNPASDIIL